MDVFDLEPNSKGYLAPQNIQSCEIGGFSDGDHHDHENDTMIVYHRYKVLIVLLIVFLAVALRAYRLDSQSLWNDEILTHVISDQHTIGILTGAESKNFPALYFLITKLAMQLGNQGWLLRFPSLLFGSLSVLLFYMVISSFFGSMVGFISSIIMALSPFHIWYSQEARPYSFLIFLSLLSLWLLKLLTNRTNSHWLYFGAIFSTALTLYCSYFAVAFIGFANIYIMLNFPRQSWSYKIGLCGGIWILTTPLLYKMAATPPLVSENAYHSFNPAALAYLIWSFGTGYSLGPTLDELHMPDRMSILVSHAIIVVPVLLFFCFLFVLGVLRLWKFNKLHLVTITSWFLLPLILLILGSVFTNHPFNIRYAILAFPPFLALIAIAIHDCNRIKWQFLGILALIFINLLSLGNYFFDVKYHKENNRDAGHHLAKNAQPGDLVIVSPAYTAANVKHYASNRNLTIMGYPQNRAAVDIVSYDADPNSTIIGAQYVQPHQLSSDLKTITAGQGHFWVFLSRTYHSDPNGYIKAYCDTHYKLISYNSWNGVELILYHIQ